MRTTGYRMLILIRETHTVRHTAQSSRLPVACSGRRGHGGQALRAAGAQGGETPPCGLETRGASALSRHNASPAPWAAGGGRRGARRWRWLGTRPFSLHVAAAFPWKGWVAAFPLWLGLCCASSVLGTHVSFVFLMLTFNQIIVRVMHVHLRALVQGSKGQRRE